MTKVSSAVAALTTTLLLTVSISSANAGWGTNGQYGNAPGQGPSAPVQSAPAQSGGYGGGQAQTRPQVMCIRAPCNVNLQRPTYERPAYVERPVYAPQRPVYVERPVYAPQRPVYQRPVYVERPVYAPQRPVYVERPVYAPQRPVYERPVYNTGSVYGGSTSSRPAQTTSSWNTSGGYGGSR
jgi:hypothetical protein